MSAIAVRLILQLPALLACVIVGAPLLALVACLFDHACTWVHRCRKRQVTAVVATITVRDGTINRVVGDGPRVLPTRAAAAQVDRRLL